MTRFHDLSPSFIKHSQDANYLQLTGGLESLSYDFTAVMSYWNISASLAIRLVERCLSFLGPGQVTFSGGDAGAAIGRTFTLSPCQPKGHESDDVSLSSVPTAG